MLPHRYMTTSATTGFNPEMSLARIELPISGLPQKQPAPALESALRLLDGVSQANLNTTTGKLWVEYDLQRVNLAQMADTAKSVGFRLDGAQTRIGIENLRCASCV